MHLGRRYSWMAAAIERSVFTARQECVTQAIANGLPRKPFGQCYRPYLIAPIVYWRLERGPPEHRVTLIGPNFSQNTRCVLYMCGFTYKHWLEYGRRYL